MSYLTKKLCFKKILSYAKVGMMSFNSHFQTINLYIGSGDDTDLPENMTLYLNIMKSVFDHANYQGSFK